MKFIKEHLGFILTMIITYILGILLIVIQYIAMDGDKNFMEVFLNSLIPTTITYVLGCVLVNIAELLRDKSDEYVFNIFTCLLVMVYAIIFCMYIIMGFSVGWVIGELLSTVLLLFLNVMCYNEKYKHRNHGLV